MRKNKKAVSNIITIIILILIVFSVIVVVFNLILKQTRENSGEIEKKFHAISNIDLKIVDAYIQEGIPNKLYIVVTNTGQQDITSFVVRVTGTNDTYLNNSVYLPNKEKLGPLNTRNIIIIPVPDPGIYGKYIKIEVYPKFEFKGNEEIAETAKKEVDFGTGGGGGGGSSSPYGEIPVVGSKCGNGAIDLGEECDDGNNDDLEGCSSICKIETTSLTSEKIKATYGPSSADERDIDELKSHGINAFIIKGNYVNDRDYSNEEDNLPNSTKQFASWAKQKDMMFFQALNFVHFTTNSTVTNNNVVYSDGTTSTHVSLWDETYWQHLTELTVNLANLSVAHPDQYRIDGIWFDFELYSNDKIWFTKSWGFEDSTFNQYLTNRNLENLNNSPKNSGQAAERYSWLESNNKLDDYYLFLEETIRQLAENLKNEVKAVNPDFLIGAYPHPTSSKVYLSDIYAGWSSRYEPAIIWSSESYWVGGADQIPSGLSNAILPEGYYSFQDVYGKEIYAYYVGGLINYAYPPTNWAYNLYNVAKNSNGYWIYEARYFTESLENLGSYDGMGCYNPLENIIKTCENSAQYAETIDFYYQQMNITTEELNKLANDENYSTYLTKSSPEPLRYRDPGIISSLGTLTLNTIQQQSGSLSFSEKIRFREQHNFIIKAEQDKNVEIELENIPLGSHNYGLAYIIFDQNNNEILRGGIGLGAQETISFTASQTGYYTLLINPTRGRFSINNINTPLMLYNTDKIHLINYWSIYFWIDSNISNFNINFQGGGGTEGLKATIYKPTATGYEEITSGETTELTNSFSLNINVPADAKDKIWKLEISRPSYGALEDVYIDFDENIQPYFGLTDNESYFMR